MASRAASSTPSQFLDFNVCVTHTPEKTKRGSAASTLFAAGLGTHPTADFGQNPRATHSDAESPYMLVVTIVQACATQHSRKQPTLFYSQTVNKLEHDRNEHTTDVELGHFLEQKVRILRPVDLRGVQKMWDG
jgi:hypothetical protein